MTAAWQGFMTPAEGYSEEESVAVDWSDYSKAQLAAELEKRGLPKSGTKDKLIARLEEDDA